MLAMLGGRPVRTLPVPPWPHYAPDEIEAATDVLVSGKVNQWTGRLVRAFESRFGKELHGRHAVAVANGTFALEACVRALGIGPGDEVIVTPRSFVASATCVLQAGATPVFADVDLRTQLITPATISPLIGPRTKAIIPVHLHGRPCDMPGIMRIAEQHGLLVIEDCAQSLGARIGELLVGTFGHAAAFSFCQDKIMSTGGEGGMALFADEAAARSAWSIKDHGKSLDALVPEIPSYKYRWLHQSLGSNGRMTEFQAAIGCCQIPKLENWLQRRAGNAERLAARLSAFPCAEIAPLPPGHRHAYYRFELSVAQERLRSGWDRDRILEALVAEGIAASPGTCPEIYREQVFARQRKYPPLPHAQRLGATSLTLLTHPTIDEQYLADCEAAIDKVFEAASA